MGLSSYPAPTDAGVFCVILVNTVISISIVKEIVRSFLHIIGIHIATSSSSSEEYSINGNSYRQTPSESYMEDFRSHTPSIRYDSLCKQDCCHECSVCLTEFKPEAEINHLSCGHVFHKPCLEKWLMGWNVTCPLCRNYMMPQEGPEEDTCPM